MIMNRKVFDLINNVIFVLLVAIDIIGLYVYSGFRLWTFAVCNMYPFYGITVFGVGFGTTFSNLTTHIRIRILCYYIMLIGSIISIAMGAFSAAGEISFFRAAKIADATNNYKEFTDSSMSDFVEFSYNVGGKEFKSEIMTTEAEAKKAKKVYYDPKNPENIKITNYTVEHIAYSLLFIVYGFLCFVMLKKDYVVLKGERESKKANTNCENKS